MLYWHVDRSTLIDPKKPHTVEKDKVFFTTTCNPANPDLRTSILNNWPLLADSKWNDSFFFFFFFFFCSSVADRVSMLGCPCFNRDTWHHKVISWCKKRNRKDHFSSLHKFVAFLWNSKDWAVSKDFASMHPLSAKPVFLHRNILFFFIKGSLLWRHVWQNCFVSEI